MERIIILEYIKVVIYRARTERGNCSINQTAVTLDFAASKSIFRLKSNAYSDSGKSGKAQSSHAASLVFFSKRAADWSEQEAWSSASAYGNWVSGVCNQS